VAAKLLRESRRTPGEIKAWSRRFRRINALFAAMWDADEGRRAPGWATSLLNGFYNSIMMPPVYVIFRLQSERRRRRQAAQLQALV
jgi:hypothetical protein